MGIIRSRPVRLMMIQASDQIENITLLDSSVSLSLSFPAIGSLASIQGSLLPLTRPATSSTPAQRESNPSLSPNRLSALIKHTATTACATIQLITHPNPRHASRPDRVCTPAVTLHAMQESPWLHHATSTPDRSELTFDERSHVFRSQAEHHLQ